MKLEGSEAEALKLDPKRSRHRAMLATLLAAALSGLHAQTPDDRLHELYRTRQWFELRTALTATAPLHIRGVVASRFNDVTVAEPLLRRVIREGPRSEEATDAHNVLMQIYIRTGQYARARREIDAWTAAQGDGAALREATKDAAIFRDLPDQNTGPRRRAQLVHEPGEITLPVTINGKRADYLFDTGAWISLITRQEVARLGLSVRDGDRPLSDGVLTAAVRTVVVPELTVGGTRFRNVSFAVIDAPGEFGILGVPVLLGLGRIDWSQASTVETGGVASAAEPRTPNLIFDGNHLLLRMKAFDKDVLTLFDTGAQTTDLTANFAAAFPDVVRRGEKSTKELTGIGGTHTAESVRLPSIAFTIGDRVATLRPAHVVLENFPGMGADCCVGNAGSDLVKQGAGFAIDLTRMTLTLR
jgi:predicted aspartyl protease